jgi:hypothetical protein
MPRPTAAGSTKPGGKVTDTLARQDRQDKCLLSDELDETRRRGIQHLRLDRQHQYLWRRNAFGVGYEPDALPVESRAAGLVEPRIDRGDAGRIEPQRQPAREHRLAHLARADDNDRGWELMGHRFLASGQSVQPG